MKRRRNLFNLFGNIYAAVMLALCVLPIIWMFQFFWLVPGLFSFFVVTWIVPILGLGVGLYGLWVTRHQRAEDSLSAESSEETS